LSGSSKHTNPWADLVIAMLSVNNYPLDRTFALFDKLEAEGLFDPSVLASATASEVACKLGAAGYNRGDTMTAIFTDRLLSLGALAKRESPSVCQRTLEGRVREDVENLLADVKGVGPRVLENFFLLRGHV
jgi:hypothetical protein